MNPVRTEFNKSWIPFECRVEYFLSESKSEFDGPVTTVHGIFFNKQDELLLVRHQKRGWEVPGGHIEEAEAFLEAMERELYEEAQMACSSFVQLGYLRKEALGEKPEDCQYPYPLSYCLFYTGIIDRVDSFQGDKNIKEARFFNIAEASKNSWIISYREYFKKACSLYFSGSF